MAFVAGRNLVPKPPTGNIAFLIFNLSFFTFTVEEEEPAFDEYLGGQGGGRGGDDPAEEDDA